MGRRPSQQELTDDEPDQSMVPETEEREEEESMRDEESAKDEAREESLTGASAGPTAEETNAPADQEYHPSPDRATGQREPKQLSLFGEEV